MIARCCGTVRRASQNFEPLKVSFRDFHKCLLLRRRSGIIRVRIVLRKVLKPHVRIFPRLLRYYCGDGARPPLGCAEMR